MTYLSSKATFFFSKAVPLHPVLNNICKASEAWNSFDIDEAHDSNDGMPSGGSLASWEFVF